MQPGLKGDLGRSSFVIRRRLAVWVAALIASLTFLSACAAVSACAADTSVRCAGYGECSVRPLTTHSYQDHEYSSWWAMYAGDNCTNYTAYVESQVYGVPTPGYLLGDGYQWAGNAAAHGNQVDGVPSVGSVAAWGSDANGMGFYGHVAVVEAVGPDDSYIDVSQSGMGTSMDGYDWERIYANQPSWEPWPTDFIHFTGTQLQAPVVVPKSGMRLAGAEITLAGS